MTFRALILIAPVLLALTVSCRIEPVLYLRQSVQAELSLETEINVEYMWQATWKTEWAFNWDEVSLGTLGYVIPSSMTIHTFAKNSEGIRKNHTLRNFHGQTATVPIYVGAYDILFHNNDSEALLFSQENELADVMCYTRTISTGLKASSQVLTSIQKMSGTKADSDFESEPVILMPDGLFSLYKEGFVVSDNPDDYEIVDGKYIVRVEGDLLPYTFIYLVQVHLLNNAGRVIGSEGGAAITGMASGVNLVSGVSFNGTASVPMEVYMDREEDMLGARVLTFGIPGVNPYDEQSLAANAESKHFLVMNITYANGTWKNVRIDISDKVREIPLGGLIDLELDVNDFPPEGATTGGGGFSALIGDWEEEEVEITIIN